MRLPKPLILFAFTILHLAADELVEMSGSGEVSSGFDSSGEGSLSSGTESVDLGSGLDEGSGSGEDENKKPHCKSDI
jgi:hypothetical protein